MEAQKPHPFGELLRLYRSRKQGLTQARLAHAMGYDEAIVIRMAQGKKDLTGPSGRDRVLSLVRILHEEGALSTSDEANALLAAAGLPPLYVGLPQEAKLIGLLAHKSIPSTPSPTVRLVAPAPLTPLLGREREVKDVIQLFTVARLITLTGAGGSGKTRCAIEIANRICGDFPQGAGFISLASTSHAENVSTSIMASIGIPLVPNLPARETIIRFLRDKSMLLVLDNFEHVIEAAPLISDLLTAAPRLKVLVTSRETLRLRGEQIYAIEPLNLQSARELFIARARAVWPGFAFTPDDHNTLDQLCQRLDRLPLAIELAAAWVRPFPLPQLLIKLTAENTHGMVNLDLLNKGARDLPERQRTMRETIAWSYQLLSSAEQRLLRMLSVFVGGAAIDQLVQVTGQSEVDVSETLYSLLAKNLVYLESIVGQEVRYWELELVRAFAHEQLKETDELAEAKLAHAVAFTRLAEAAKTHILGAVPYTQQPWIERLEREVGNIRAMIAWSLSQDGELSWGLRLVAALTWHLRMQVQIWHQEAWIWVSQMRQRLAPDTPPALKAWLLMLAGFPPTHGSDAVGFSIDSLHDARLSGEDDCIANSLNALGVDLNHHYSDGRGIPLIEESVALARKLGYSVLVVHGLYYLAQARRDYDQQPGEALALLTEAIAICEATHHRMLLAPALLMAAGCALHQLDFVSTLSYVHKASSCANLQLSEGCEQYRCSVEALLGLGDIDRAEQMVQTGYRLVSEINNTRTMAFWLALMAKVALSAGKEVVADDALKQSYLTHLNTPTEIAGMFDLLENLHVTPTYILEVGACLACAKGDFIRSARLFGAGHANRQTHRVPREPYFEHWQLPYVAKCKSVLGDEVFKSITSQQVTIEIEQAIL